jgi:carbon storage regulator
MLVLNRKKGQRVVVGNQVEVVVLEVRGDRVKLGFAGPPEVPIHREELHRKIADAALPVADVPCGCGWFRTPTG